MSEPRVLVKLFL